MLSRRGVAVHAQVFNVQSMHGNHITMRAMALQRSGTNEARLAAIVLQLERTFRQIQTIARTLPELRN